MNVVLELTTLVEMSKKVRNNCDDSADNLAWYMPSRTNNLRRKYDRSDPGLGLKAITF